MKFTELSWCDSGVMIYTKDHMDKSIFLKGVSKYLEDCNSTLLQYFGFHDETCFDKQDVQHGYLRITNFNVESGESSPGYTMVADGPGRGAFKATWCEVI